MFDRPHRAPPHSSFVALISPELISQALISTGLLLSTLACTEPLPPEQARQAAQTQGEARAHLSAQERAALSDPKSLFQRLALDPSPLDAWERSDAWVAFFQGDLASAIEGFTKDTSPRAALGLARAHLELAEAHATLATATTSLAQAWLNIERQSPHASVYGAWYDWVERASLEAPLSVDQQALAQTLDARLKAHATLSAWAPVAAQLTAEAQPSEASAGYRLWLSFAGAVKAARTGDAEALKRARALHKRLHKRKARALTRPIYTAHASATEGAPAHPELRVFDPRLPRVARDYHALEVINALSKDKASAQSPWAPLLLARAHRALGEHAQALKLTEGLLAADAKTPLPEPSVDVLLLTPHLTKADLLLEVHALRDASRCAAPQTNTLPPHAPQATPPSKESRVAEQVWALWREASCLAPSPTPSTEPMTALPQARRQLLQLTLELTQGPAAERIAALGLAERWADALHERLAEGLIGLDQRVLALKALSSAEDPSAPLRLGGRNRLSRLALSATHQLTLKRLRVASKYLLRLRDDLPASVPLSEMTSDVLSGTSFSATGQVNAGQ